MNHVVQSPRGDQNNKQPEGPHQSREHARMLACMRATLRGSCVLEHALSLDGLTLEKDRPLFDRFDLLAERNQLGHERLSITRELGRGRLSELGRHRLRLRLQGFELGPQSPAHWVPFLFRPKTKYPNAAPSSCRAIAPAKCMGVRAARNHDPARREKRTKQMAP